MDLIIIGNGFDLAHGIACSYLDFRNYLETTNSEALRFLQEMYPKRNNKQTLLLWSDFEEALAFPNKKWRTDFEELFRDDDINKSAGLLVSILEEDFYGWIDEVCFTGSCFLPENHPYKRFLKKENIYLCFNYTDTLERFYGINDVNYIHGKAYHRGEETTVPLIFGHRHVRGGNPLITATEKPVARIIEKNSEWFHRISGNVNGEIVVMGLSCSEVDQEYLIIIRHVLPGRKWRFFYYSEEDLKRIKSCAENIGLSASDYFLESSKLESNNC